MGPWKSEDNLADREHIARGGLGTELRRVASLPQRIQQRDRILCGCRDRDRDLTSWQVRLDAALRIDTLTRGRTPADAAATSHLGNMKPKHRKPPIGGR